ncbi:MAG: hypothetical protein KC478_06745 [Bacteriovoracaceae bacterium]|nr:hypothetical protein [Bacteriovoracaceae bacterium]
MKKIVITMLAVASLSSAFANGNTCIQYVVNDGVSAYDINKSSLSSAIKKLEQRQSNDLITVTRKFKLFTSDTDKVHNCLREVSIKDSFKWGEINSQTTTIYRLQQASEGLDGVCTYSANIPAKTFLTCENI